jgi:hypothetical protein
LETSTMRVRMGDWMSEMRVQTEWYAVRRAVVRDIEASSGGVAIWIRKGWWLTEVLKLATV